MIEVDVEGDPFQIFGGELKRGLREIDPPIVADLGVRKGASHLPRIAAGDIEKINRLWNRHQGTVKNVPDLPMGKDVVIHDLLIDRPPFLKLHERGLVVDRSAELDVVKVNTQGDAASGALRKTCQRR